MKVVANPGENETEIMGYVKHSVSLWLDLLFTFLVDTLPQSGGSPFERVVKCPHEGVVRLVLDNRFVGGISDSCDCGQ